MGAKAPLQVVYVDGVDRCDPCVTIRLDKMSKGEYYILYRADFKKEHKCKKLNMVFYSEFQQKLSNEEAAQIVALQKSNEKSRENLNRIRSQSSLQSKRSAKTSKNQVYEHDMAIEFEKLDNKSFEKGFYDRMESINYARLI